MNLALDGKVALVTGAARGIGLAIARQLARQNALVVLADLPGMSADLDDALALVGPRAESEALDVTDEIAVDDLAARLLQRHGGIDILVNNAGISPKKKGRKFYLEETRTADWRRVMAVNLDAVFLLARALVPQMKARGGGRIVNISSQAGRGRSDLTSAHYATSKAGVVGLTRSLACELGRHGFCVNAVAPGFIETGMSAGYTPERRQAVLDSIPVRRAGSVQDVANAVGFLASPAAGFINGAVLDINGGSFM